MPLDDAEIDAARGAEALRIAREKPDDVKNFGAFIHGADDLAAVIGPLAARLAREGWMPPVDADLVEARKLAGDYVVVANVDYTGSFERECRTGKVDRSAHVVCALAGIKRGRELEREGMAADLTPRSSIDIRTIKDGERVRVTFEAGIDAQLHNEVYLRVGERHFQNGAYVQHFHPAFLDRCTVEKVV